MSQVSVVMANYNYGRYLRAAVESVLGQTLHDLELIVVDDGSSDDSLTILETYKYDSRLRVLNVQHVGQPAAKNAGIAETTAPFIAFLDADDRWHTEKLERQLALFEGKPNVGVVYCRRTLIDENDRDLPYEQPALFRGDVLSRIFRSNFVCFSSVVVRRLVFEHVGWFDPSVDLAIDYDLWLRVAAHYHFDFVDAPLVQYRVGHGNLSRRVGERLTTALLMMRRFLHRHDGNQLFGNNVSGAALAETSCNMAFSLRPFDRAQSARWFARALAHRPSYRPAWRALMGLGVPAALRPWLRRRNDWDAVYRCPENDPRNV